MEAIINKTLALITAEENNEMLAQGFKYEVEGDWRTLDTTDPWSGMPNVAGNTHYFTDKAEAEAYAETQTWVFNDKIRGAVLEVVREETWAEFNARLDAEKKARAEKKAQSEAKKAEEKGMTVAEYRVWKNTEAIKRKYAREIEELKAEIAKREKYIAEH